MDGKFIIYIKAKEMWRRAYLSSNIHVVGTSARPKKRICYAQSVEHPFPSKSRRGFTGRF